MTDHYTIKLRGPADLERVNKMAQWAAGQVGKGWTIIATRKRSVDRTLECGRLLNAWQKRIRCTIGVQMDATDWKDLFCTATWALREAGRWP
jgi:hypothetical protein